LTVPASQKKKSPLGR